MSECDHFWVLFDKIDSWRYWDGDEKAQGTVLVVGEDTPRQYFQARDYYCAKCREHVRDEIPRP